LQTTHAAGAIDADDALRTGGHNVPGSHAKQAAGSGLCAAVAAALLFAFYNAYEARVTNATIQRTRDTLEKQIHMQQATARELAVARREALILTDPKSLKIAMLAGKKGLPMLRATWNPGLGLVVSGQKLQNPSVNRTLQLWLIPKAAEAKPVPSLTSRPTADEILIY
jgi:hypothetical protein